MGNPLNLRERSKRSVTIMKRKVLSLILAGTLCLSMAACGSSSGNSGTSSDGSAKTETASDSSTTESGDVSSFKDAEGKDVAVVPAEEYTIGGQYICPTDKSVWTFLAEQKILSVAYLDENTGSLGNYLCSIDMYATDEESGDEARLVMQVTNLNTGDVSFWYVTNFVDEDGTVVGVELIEPGNEDQTVGLLTQDYYNENMASGDAE